MIIAVIDLGKTNSKVALVDTAKARELEVLTQIASINNESAYPSLDHLSIEEFVLGALSKLGNRCNIDGITVTTHGATAALLDAQGKLALPVVDYEFTGIDALRNEYNRHRPPFAETGSPGSPGGLNIGAQLYWLQQEFPTEFSLVKTVLTWPQYWVYLLTGQAHNDVSSLGAHTDLYQPHQKKYSSLVDVMQWHTLMPPTQPSGALSGPILPEIAKKTGLPGSTPVYTGIHDSNASLVPHLITHDAPFSVLSTGTWFIAMAIGGKPVTLDEDRDTLLNINAFGSAVRSARFMGGRERELLGVTQPASESTIDTLLQHQTPPHLLPSVVPDTGPYAKATKVWINPTDNKFLNDGAITLYLALMASECLQLIGAEGPTYIEGPLAHDQYFAQMLAASSKRPVWLSDSKTGTSVGAAMLVSPPETLPTYTRVELEETRLQMMQSYATSWRQYLRIHTSSRQNS